VLAALECDIGDTVVFKKLGQADLMRLFQLLYCERLCGRGRPAFGHLCSAKRTFVRYSTSRCVMPYTDEELSVDVALVGRLSSWVDDVCRGTDRIWLPLPEIMKIQAKNPISAIAPVTRAGQVLAVLPELWGEDQAIVANPLVSSGQRQNFRTSFRWNAAVRVLERMEEILDEKGECAVVRTHQSKTHIFTAAQAKVAAASSYNPSLGKVLKSLDIDSRLYAIVYLQRDPGFFCFN